MTDLNMLSDEVVDAAATHSGEGLSEFVPSSRRRKGLFRRKCTGAPETPALGFIPTRVFVDLGVTPPSSPQANPSVVPSPESNSAEDASPPPFVPPPSKRRKSCVVTRRAVGTKKVKPFIEKHKKKSSFAGPLIASRAASPVVLSPPS